MRTPEEQVVYMTVGRVGKVKWAPTTCASWLSDYCINAWWTGE